MLFHEFKSLLSDNPAKSFKIQLPGGESIPASFHITEIGFVKKVFIDCGGTRRESECCLLQIWVGNDFDHSLETEKMLMILTKGADLLPNEQVALEFEYEHAVISQYLVSSHEISENSITLYLKNKHTECLAPELCGIKAFPPRDFNLPPLPTSANTCRPGSNCC